MSFIFREVDCDNFPVEFSVEFIKKHLLSLPSIEPRGDLISREDALIELNGVCSNWQDDCKVAEIINGLPPAEYSKPLQTTLNDDLISREDAIEAIQTAYCIPCKELGNDYNGIRCRSCEFNDAMIEIDSVLSPEAENRHYIKIYADDEPFVKAEKLYQICDETQSREVAEWLKEYFPLSDDNWIPVSEKLPDEDDYNEYLVIDDRGYMAVGNYRHDAKAWDSSNFGWLEIRDKTDEFPWGIDKVVAWYKPKPYKESKVEE